MTDFYKGKRVLVTGAYGFLGTHLVKKLRERGAFIIAPTRDAMDLTRLFDCSEYMYHRANGNEHPIDILFHLAAVVGGIHYNLSNPVALIEDNCKMAFNAMWIAKWFNAKAVCAGSVCAYPKNVPVPACEENLYEGYPEESNGPYGSAKRILLETQKAFYSQFKTQSVHIVSANLYGPGDNFNLKESHVIPGLIVKIQDAINAEEDVVTVWGTGKASRDFLYVGDAVDAYLAAGEFIDEPPQPINIASNEEVPIHYLVSKLCEIMGFGGKIVYDSTMPDGQPRRAFKTNRMEKLTGWKSTTKLEVGLTKTVEYYRNEVIQKVA